MQLNPSYLSDDTKARLKAALNDRTCIKIDEDISFDPHPFPHCTLRNFVTDEQFLSSLQEELNALEYHQKSNDLYKFCQSGPLQACKSPLVQEFRKFLYDSFLQWMKEVTGIELTEVVDMTAARYTSTDVLLCHDDELEGRRIAFIYYLVPADWKPEDGGALNLFDSDEFGQPKDIAKSILPVRNTLLFFEVTTDSFHEVAEVLCKDKCRQSVSGWFHGPPIERPAPYREPALPRLPCVPVDDSPIDEDVLYSWINSTYLAPSVQHNVRKRFEDNSEIQLDGFLQKEKYNALSEAIRSSDINWVRRGSAIKRRYDVADVDSLPEILKQFTDLFKSEAMFLILAGLTGLTGLHKMASSENADDDDNAEDSQSSDNGSPPSKKSCKSADSNGAGEPSCSSMSKASVPTTPSLSIEIRRWSHGCYTLIHDEDTDQGVESALDVLVHFNCSGWCEEQGGYKSYVSKGEDEELLSIFPEENVLALVYRDKDTLGFVKHVTHKVATLDQGCLYDISLVYYE